MSKRRIFKYSTLALILIWGFFKLLPEREETAVNSDQEAPSPAKRDVKHVIKFAPGNQYTPGVSLFGMSEPLEGLTKVIRKYEERHPDTRIEVFNVPTVQREYLVTQLSSGAAPDIVKVNVEDVWVDVHKNWYVPLDTFLEQPNPYVVEKGDPDLPGARQWWDMFRYQALTRGKAGPDGKYYCYTLDAVETGIFYNKTLFGRLGLEVPQTMTEFFYVAETIKKNGYIPLIAVLQSYADWGVDLIFDQLYYELLPGIDLVKDPTREAYLQGYLDSEEIAFLHSKGFFTKEDPRFLEKWRLLKQLRQYLAQEMNVRSGQERQFINQQAAMVWLPSTLTYRLVADKNLGFEWGVFYFPMVDEAVSEMASNTPACVVGGAATQFEVTNSAVSDTDPSLPFEERMLQSERLKRVIGFLQFLSLPENAELVTNENPRFIPNIVGVEPLPELEPFEKILERRYTTTKWLNTFDLRFFDVLQRMFALYLEDGATLEELVSWMDDNISASSELFENRKGIDWESLEKRWQELAPAREGMTFLPKPLQENPAL